MAANDEILGVSAHMDISDIQRSIDSLINGLDAIGVKTDVLSRRMNDAMNEIARSTDDSATKQKRAMDVLAQGMAEVKTAMTNYPDALRQAKNEADATAQATARLESQLAKMKTQFDATNVGSKTFEELKTSIAGVEQQIISNNQAHEAQLATIQQMEAGYNSLVQLYGVADAAVLANAAAHTMEAGTTTAAALAHTKNASEITTENQKLEEQEQNIQKTADAASGLEERIQSLIEKNAQLAEEMNNMTDRGEQFEAKQREYQEREKNIEALKEEQRQIMEFGESAVQSSQKMAEASTTQEEMSEKVREGWAAFFEEFKGSFDALDPMIERIKDKLELISTTPENEAFINSLRDQITVLEEMKSQSLSTVDAKQRLIDAVNKLSDDEAKLDGSIEQAKNSVQSYQEQIKDLNAELETLKEKREEALQLGKGFMIPSAVADWGAEHGIWGSTRSEEINRINEDIKKKKEEITEAERKLQAEIRKTADETRNVKSETTGIRGVIDNLTGGFSNLGKSIKNTFSQLKGGFTGGGEGFSGIFKLITSGKFLGWTAAIGAIGGSIKGLSDSAEKLKLALDPLRAYVDDDVLGKLRKSFIDTAMLGSAQGADDMARAALQWIKYYNSIKDVPEAVQAVVDASRQLATLTGTSAEKAAQTLTKLGGQFHLTAEEATKAVNVLVNASHDSVVNINELMQALTSSGARVKLNGADLKEYAAAVAQTSSQYGSASQAASAYQRVLQRLSTEANDNFNPKVVGATKAFQNLKKEMDKGTDLSKKFGKMVWSQAQYFIKNADAIADYTKELDGAEKKQNALSRAEETAEYNKKMLKNSVDALAMSIDINLTPMFNEIIKGLTSIVEWVGKGIRGFDNLSERISTLFGKALVKGDNLIKSVIGEDAFNFINNILGYIPGYKTGKTEWTDSGVRNEVKKILDRNGGMMGKDGKTSIKELLDWYDSSNPTGLTREEVRAIAMEEAGKYVKGHKALEEARIKGENSEIGEDNSITDPKGLQKAEQQAKLEEDLAKRRRKYQEEQKRQEVDAEIAEWELRISKMKEGYAKEEEERRLEHERRLNQIEQQKKQMLEKNIEYAAAEYDKRKKKGSKGFYALGLDQQVGLTPEQQRIYDAQIEAEKQRRINEEKQVEDELIRSHQSYIDKKKEIDKNYQETLKQIDEAITQAESRGDHERVNALIRSRAQAARDYAKEQARAALDKLQDSPLYTEAFDDLSKASTTAIHQLIQDFEKVKGAIKTPTELREFQNTLNQLYEELAERDPIGVLTDSFEKMGKASEELKKAEERLDAVKSGKKLIKKITVTKDKQVVEELWEEKDAVEAVTNALKNYSAAKSRVDKAIDAMQSKVAKFADAFKQLGNAIGGTEGEVISIIGETLDFVNTVVDGIQQISKISEVTDQTIKAIQKTAEASAEGVKTASKAAVVAISAMEKASIILTIISAAIQLAQQISELLPDKYDQYKQFSDKVNEINKATKAVRDYTTAVMKAQQAEENWFSTTELKGLADQFELSSKALDDYYDALLRPQAIYENESGGGWLTKLGGYASQTIGKWSDAVNEFFGIEDTFLGHAMGEMAKFGWANLAGGPIGQSMYWENYIWKKGWDEAYREGQVAAYRNLRIETRAASSGFLGTGIGGHSQETEDLVEYVRKNLHLELFDEKGLLDLKVYEQVMEKYGDRLVGDTEETLKELAELKEAYEEYQKKLEEYISELYSPLSDAMVDALWDFYSTGTDVMDAFKDYSVDVFKNIGKEITKTLVNSLIFDKFKERLEQIYTKYSKWKSLGMSEELSLNMLTSELFRATDDFLETAEQQIPIMQQAVERLQNGLEERGLLGDTTNPDQQATYNSLEKWTYDQADELISRATAMQIIDEHIYEGQMTMTEGILLMAGRMETITGTISSISENIAQSVEMHRDANEKLEKLVLNTNPIPEIRDILKKIYNEK